VRAVRNEKFESVAVTVRAKAADNRLRHVAEIGMLAERLACVRIRQMHFDKGNLYGGQCIAQRNAGMGKRGGIDQDEAGAVGTGGLNAINELMLGIGLEAFQLMPNLCGTLAQAAIDLFQCGAAIDARLAFAEQIQVGTV